MFKTYLKIAWRNLWKNKLFSLINIISLSIGLSASIVIGMMVYYDFTFDKFHPDGDRIYRVTSKFIDPEGISFNSGVPVPLVLEVNDNFTNIESTAFLYTFHPYTVKASGDNNAIKEPNFITFANTDYFNLFNYQWLAGNPFDQLINPNEVVLTVSRASQYFPDKKPSQIIGQTITYNDSIPALITGVVADFKQRSDLVFKEFISLETIKQTDRKDQFTNSNWHNTNSAAQLLVKLQQGTDASSFQNQLDKVALKQEDAESIKYGDRREFYAQPFLDLHFDKRFGNFYFTNNIADKNMLLMLGLIAVFLLLLGCVNFINLNTAQATQRSKEIGIRKTLGSSKKQLVAQFIVETFILTLIAGILSLLLAAYLLNIFNDFIADGLEISMLLDPYLLCFLVLLIITVTLLAGFYPSLVLSKFKPVKTLKGEDRSSRGKIGLRKFLTVFQFTIAFIFIISTLLIGKQIKFLLAIDMGFKTDAVVYISTPYQVKDVESRELLAQKLKALPQLDKVSIGGQPPASSGYNQTVFQYEGDNGERITNVNLVFGDSHYLDLYNIPLIAGRLPKNDTIKEVVINQVAAKNLGFNTPEEAIEKIVNPNNGPLLITGVMKNFHSSSLKYEINAMAFNGDLYRSFFSQFQIIHMKIKPSSFNDMSNTLKLIKNQFNQVYPNATADIQFMDETVASFYEKERSTSKLLNWAMALSVLISCLGLLGLVIYNTERRVKEIGIRKVLGATVAQLNLLLCKDFLWLIGIAFLIAAPIAYWGLNNWLQDYAARTVFSWWIFAGSISGMIILAVAVMSIKTVSAALENPVKNLKTE